MKAVYGLILVSLLAGPEGEEKKAPAAPLPEDLTTAERIEGGIENLTCRRALARLKVPEIDADMVIPVADWLPPPR